MNLERWRAAHARCINVFRSCTKLVACLVLGLIVATGLPGEGHTAVNAEETAPSEPQLEEPALTDYDYEYWSFEPLAKVDPPEVKNAEWCRTSIDRFILAELEEHELVPLSEADRETLLRRVTFDLTGLPPTVAEIDAFLADEEPGAYERVVDRLLSDPAYGERFGRHWLDLARFAETDGFEHDEVRASAWMYRDWVIRSLNSDMPYDRFVQQQIAGDELEPDNPDAHLATGFLLAGPDMPDIDLKDERRHNFLNNMTATVGEVFLGLQYGCAQCHDHKSDPLSIHDFYRMRAFFESIDLFHEQPLPTAQHVAFVEEAPAESEKPEPVRIAKTILRDVPSRVWLKGDFRRPGPIVKPAAPRIACSPERNRELQTRADLALWITEPDNPLTTRVIVNRAWQQHFGVGLCATSSDFGLMGDWPTHEDLIDWLAQEFVKADWSLKALHRLIVTSSVYRTRSYPDASETDLWTRLQAEDSGNQWWGRFPRRRLDAEEIRDGLLAIAGDLNRDRGGPGVRPPLPPAVVQTLLANQWPVSKDPSDHVRRSIYLFVRRNLRYPLFEVFDQPDTNRSCARRVQTTIAPQALHLLNSELSVSSARHFASRVQAAGTSPTESIILAHRMALGRFPNDDEMQSSQRFLQSAGPEGFNDLCLMLLNLNEFLYVD